MTPAIPIPHTGITPRDTPRVLSIAGTDPTGGAGQQADLKTITALGGYGMSVITAVVAQNTTGVRSIHVPPREVLVAQLKAVSDDVVVDAVKIGMLGSVPVIQEVSAWLAEHRPPVVVLDPVMVATTGGRLLDHDAEAAMRSLLHRADLVTPNVPELAVLLDEEVAQTWSGALAQGQRLADTYAVQVLVKGGHLPGPDVPDALVAPGHSSPLFVAHDPRIVTANTHGTGCSISSAVAVLASRTGDWVTAVGLARQWLRGALQHADELEVGQGNGPVHHGHHLADAVDEAIRTWTTRVPATVSFTKHTSLWEAATGSDAESAESQQNAVPIASDWSHLSADDSFTGQLWAEAADVRSRIQRGAFVPRLADGSLPQSAFLDYLAQDLAYLQDYSRALAQLAVRAPSESWRALFAAGAAGCAEETAGLHRTLVAADAQVRPSAVTAEYTDFLLATTQTRNWAVGVAAVLPCYWLYAWIGVELQQQRQHSATHLDHPYAAWLDSYADPEFAAAAEKVRAVVDELAAQSTDDVRDAMRAAFHRACELEFRFFEDPWARYNGT